MADRLRLGPREYYQDVTNLWVPRNVASSPLVKDGVIVHGPGVLFGASWTATSDQPIYLYDSDTSTLSAGPITLPCYSDFNGTNIGGNVWWGPNGLRIERAVTVRQQGNTLTSLWWVSTV